MAWVVFRRPLCVERLFYSRLKTVISMGAVTTIEEIEFVGIFEYSSPESMGSLLMTGIALVHPPISKTNLSAINAKLFVITPSFPFRRPIIKACTIPPHYE